MADLFVFDPWFYAVAIFAVVITGISKSGLGGGLGQLSVPLMAAFIPPLSAVAIMMPILMLMDCINIWGYRRDWHRSSVMIMLPGAVVGVAVGALTYKYVDENAVRILLGVIILMFTAGALASNAGKSEGRTPHPLVGILCGTLSGFTSTVAHAGGGPMKFYMLPQRLTPRLFVGTHVVFFFAVNVMKFVSYFWLGQYTVENLTTSAILVPFVPIGVYLGWKLVKVVPLDLFYKIVYALLFFSGSKLIWDGLTRGEFI